MNESKIWIGGLVVGPVRTNCYFVRSSEESTECVLVDPGDQPEDLVRHLKNMKVTSVAMLLTHGHYDHILGINGVREAYPSAKVYISEKERPMVEDHRLNCTWYKGQYSFTPDVYVKGGDVLTLDGMDFRVIESPGHTAGSVCYYMEREKVLFAGDTIFLESHGRTDLPTGDEEEMYRSLEKLLTTLPEDVTVLPGHGGATTIGHEREVEGFGD